MRSLSVSAVLLVFVAVSDASIGRGREPIRKGYENECYVNYTSTEGFRINTYIKLDATRYFNKPCMSMTCNDIADGQGTYEYFRCGQIFGNPQCKEVVADRFAVYPECCPYLDCPEGTPFSATG